MESHAAAHEAADDVSSSDSDVEPEETAPRNDATGHGSQQEKADDGHSGRGKKKGKRKRDAERKRPGKRQRAELKQQRSAAGLLQQPQRKGRRADGDTKDSKMKVKPAGSPMNGQQTPVKLPVGKPRRKKS